MISITDFIGTSGPDTLISEPANKLALAMFASVMLEAGRARSWSVWESRYRSSDRGFTRSSPDLSQAIIESSKNYVSVAGQAAVRVLGHINENIGINATGAMQNIVSEADVDAEYRKNVIDLATARSVQDIDILTEIGVASIQASAITEMGTLSGETKLSVSDIEVRGTISERAEAIRLDIIGNNSVNAVKIINARSLGEINLWGKNVKLISRFLLTQLYVPLFLKLEFQQLLRYQNLGFWWLLMRPSRVTLVPLLSGTLECQQLISLVLLR